MIRAILANEFNSGIQFMSEAQAKLVKPQQAWELLQGNTSAVLIDVRSDMEFLMVGHAKGAIHVSWIDEPEWTVNPNFVAEVRKVLLGRAAVHERHAPVVLICRSGNRSADAAELLLKEGFRDVYVIEGGFEGPLDEQHHRSTTQGWRFEGLPWEQC